MYLCCGPMFSLLCTLWGLSHLLLAYLMHLKHFTAVTFLTIRVFFLLFLYMNWDLYPLLLSSQVLTSVLVVYCNHYIFKTNSLSVVWIILTHFILLFPDVWGHELVASGWIRMQCIEYLTTDRVWIPNFCFHSTSYPRVSELVCSYFICGKYPT